MENDCVGSRSATSDWSDYFSLPWFASNLTLAERRGAGLTQRVKERFAVPVWTTCGKPRRVRIHWLHPRLSGSSGGNFLCSLHLYALPPARAADIRTALRQALPPHNENQRRRITLECGEHLCWNRIGARGPTVSGKNDALGVVADIDYGPGNGGIKYARSLCGLSNASLSTDSRTPDIGFYPGDSCLRGRIQAAHSRNGNAGDARGRSSGRRVDPVEKSDKRNYPGSYGRAEVGGRSLGTTHRDSGNRSPGRQITRRRQFVVGNERTTFVCENLKLGFLSLRVSAWSAIERCTNSGSLVGRASHTNRGLLLQPSRTVDLKRT